MKKIAKKTQGRKRISGIGTLGHWVDETVPDLTAAASGLLSLGEELARAGVNVAEFKKWLGPELGVFRGNEHLKASMPQRSEEIAAARELAEHIRTVAACITREATPARTHALLLSASHRIGTNWIQLSERAYRDLITIDALLTHVANLLSRGRARRGPKGTRARDVLLGRIVDYFCIVAKLDKSVARRLSLKVLRACGIVAPSPEQAAPDKAAARAAKRPN